MKPLSNCDSALSTWIRPHLGSTVTTSQIAELFHEAFIRHALDYLIQLSSQKMILYLQKQQTFRVNGFSRNVSCNQKQSESLIQTAPMTSEVNPSGRKNMPKISRNLHDGQFTSEGSYESCMKQCLQENFSSHRSCQYHTLANSAQEKPIVVIQQLFLLHFLTNKSSECPCLRGNEERIP
jgi:hypothetical protein